jgi:hemerythrin-like domain-containing protein
MRHNENLKNEHLKTLNKEHHFISLFSWKIKKGLTNDVSTNRILEYVKYFWESHLKSHFLEEEKLLFRPLMTAKVQRAIREHREITNVIEKLVAFEKKDSRKLIIQLAEMLDEHIRYEKRDLFPILERKLERRRHVDLTGQLKERKHPPLYYEYRDEFWNG